MSGARTSTPGGAASSRRWRGRRRRRPAPRRRPSPERAPSAAADVGLVLLDRAAEQGAERAADQRAAGAVAPAVDDIAEKAARRRADDEPGRAVAAPAIIAPVRAAIDIVVRAEPPLAIARVVA